MKMLNKEIVRKKIKGEAVSKSKGILALSMLALLLIAIVICVIISLFIEFIGYSYNINIINSLITVFIMVLLAPFSLGFMNMFIKNSRDEKLEVKNIFENMDVSAKYVKVYSLVMILYVIIQWVFGLIPLAGFFINLIISILFLPIYFVLPFVYMDNKDLSIKEIISKAFEVVSGRRVEFYGMLLSFAGWITLSCFTLGILFFYVLPYMYTSVASLYLHWTHEKESEKSNAISNGGVILIFFVSLIFFCLVMIVNVPNSPKVFLNFIMSGQIKSIGNTELAYGGVKVTYDAPKNYKVVVESDASRTYSNDNYNILQYSIYLSSVKDAIEMDEEIVNEMKESENYQKIEDEKFTLKVNNEKIEGYMYKAYTSEGTTSTSITAYYEVDSYVVTISLSNSKNNLSKNDIKEFITIKK